MEELFDVLNEKGQYTGRVETRQKCHKEGLWHKAVTLFILNSKGQVLLQDGKIYLSEQDLKNFFDKYIYEDEESNKIITTYDKKIAEIGFEKK